MLILEVEVKDTSVESDSWLETTAESLAKFGYEKRTDWPGVLMDLKAVAERLREFGGARFYVWKGKGPGKEGKSYLVFKGNPRKPGKAIGVRQMIRGNGPYSFKNPLIVQMGFGSKEILKGGARATVISFIVVAAIDVVAELLKDDFSLRRLGVQLSVDVVKLVVSGLAAVGVSALIATGVLSMPVWAIVAGGMAVGLAVGWGLDKLDERFAITESLQRKAEELQNRAESGLGNFFRQLQWCAMNPHWCLGR
ncbi:MAG TPA: hypothetical protein VGG33_25030 [Polyangia bacterium]